MHRQTGGSLGRISIRNPPPEWPRSSLIKCQFHFSKYIYFVPTVRSICLANILLGLRRTVLTTARLPNYRISRLNITYKLSAARSSRLCIFQWNYVTHQPRSAAYNRFGHEVSLNREFPWGRSVMDLWMSRLGTMLLKKRTGRMS